MRNEKLGISPAGCPISPSAERNKGPIADVLKRILPARGTVLEVSSGTGQHVVHFAREMPDLVWQPSEPDEPSLQWIKKRMASEAQPNILPPLRLDVTELPWQAGPVQAVVCLNMIHIAPWSAAQGLLAGAERLLRGGTPLVLYGPFGRNGEMAESNAAFDASLKSRDERWGVRDLDAQLLPLAAQHGFQPGAIIDMPANNLFVVLRRAG